MFRAMKRMLSNKKGVIGTASLGTFATLLGAGAIGAGAVGASSSAAAAAKKKSDNTKRDTAEREKAARKKLAAAPGIASEAARQKSLARRRSRTKTVLTSPKGVEGTGAAIKKSLLGEG